MRVIRIIGYEELCALASRGKIRPIRTRRDCLYFFPAYGEAVPEYVKWGGEEEWHTVPYRLDYISGIVSDYYTDKLGLEHIRIFICLNLEIDHKRLQPSWETYADPGGAFFDTISVLEYHARGGYNIEDVKAIEIWGYKNQYVAEKLVDFKNLTDAKSWVESHVE